MATNILLPLLDWQHWPANNGLTNNAQDRITTTKDNLLENIQVINNSNQEQLDANNEGELNPSSNEINKADLPKTDKDNFEDEQDNTQSLYGWGPTSSRLSRPPAEQKQW